MKHTVLLVCAFLLPVCVAAQNTPMAAAAAGVPVPAADTTNVVPPFPLVAPPAPPTPDASGRYLLHEGEDVNLEFAQDVSSKTAVDGSVVTLRLTSDLKAGDIVLARAGSKAVGTVTKAEKSGKLGHSGQLSVRLDYVEVAGNKIPLREFKGEDASGSTGQSGVLHTLAKPLAVVKHGKDSEIVKGQPEHAVVAVDVALPPVA
jgi:hypothetical protein